MPVIPTYKLSIILSADSDVVVKELTEQIRNLIAHTDCKEYSTVVLFDGRVIKDDYDWKV